MVAKALELRELDDEELESRLGEYRRELLNLRFQLATGQLDNSARIGEVKKDVARVLTVLRDRELGLDFETPAPAPAAARRRPAPSDEPDDVEAAFDAEDEVEEAVAEAELGAEGASDADEEEQ